MCLVQVEPSVQKLYDYIYERGTIVPVEDFSMELLNQGDISKRVTESIRYAHVHHHDAPSAAKALSLRRDSFGFSSVN